MLHSQALDLAAMESYEVLEAIGQKRGMLTPGEYDRTIKMSRDRLGEGKQVLLQIVSFRGLYGQVPVPEATKVIRTGENN